MFVSGRVAVTAEGVTDEKTLTPDVDVVFIRTKMDYGTRQRVVGAAAKMQQTQGGGRGKARRGKAPEMEFDVGQYSIALLRFNVLGWNGPSFAGVSCTPENIERLDPDEPLVQKVLDVIGERNTTADPDSAVALDDPNVIEAEAIPT